MGPHDSKGKVVDVWYTRHLPWEDRRGGGPGRTKRAKGGEQGLRKGVGKTRESGRTTEGKKLEQP